MSASVSLPLEREQPSLAKESLCDAALADLSPDLRMRLLQWQSKDWLSSPGFAEFYCYPPAQRVCFIRGPQDEIQEACFYLEKKWAGLFLCISLCSGTDPCGRILEFLKRGRPADLIRIPFVDSSVHEQQEPARANTSVRIMADDHCIDLPASADNYIKSLGSQTRKHLPYYLRRLKKEWGYSWQVEIAAENQIAKKSYRDLLLLNALRMDRKKRRSLWTWEIAEHRWPLVCRNGLLASILREGRLVAGTLSFTYGSQAYLTVIAHDPDEDRLNLGNICLWFTIEHLIAKRFQSYHLLWGNSPYKKQFGAIARPLYEMTVFANPSAALAWRAVELLRLEKMWGFSGAVVQKAAWLLSPARRRVFVLQDRSE